MNLKIIFTWWNKQTIGTFLKTLFLGKYVGKDEFGNKYYRGKGRKLRIRSIDGKKNILKIKQVQKIVLNRSK